MYNFHIAYRLVYARNGVLAEVYDETCFQLYQDIFKNRHTISEYVSKNKLKSHSCDNIMDVLKMPYSAAIDPLVLDLTADFAILDGYTFAGLVKAVIDLENKVVVFGYQEPNNAFFTVRNIDWFVIDV